MLEHRIAFNYENIINKFDYKNYTPEFYLPEFKCVIEYFGMKGDDEYDEQEQDNDTHVCCMLRSGSEGGGAVCA